jgi:hypothetical protein
MRRDDVTLLQILGFGDLATETWGAAWMTEPSGPARLAVGLGSAAGVFDVTLEPAEDESWQLDGEGVSLALRPAIAAITSRDAEGGLERQDALCRLDGRVRIDGREAEIACLGWRSSAHAEAGPENFDSLRFVAGWFDPAAGFSLTALRPPKTRGHEADVVAAAVVDEPPPRVVDPRLSTTYTDRGTPARAGLELWLEAEGDGDEEASLQYPRRAAGEATGASLDWSQAHLALQASLLRWHSQGREGAGVYVLGRRQ